MENNVKVQDDTQSLQSCVSVSALIAEYLGWKNRNEYYQVPNLYPVTDYDTGWTECTLSEMEFDKRWDWIMPVVEKIELEGYDSRICGNNSDGGFLCDFVDFENTEKGIGISFETKIEAVFLAVGDFLRNRV